MSSSPFPIGNNHHPPLEQVNGNFANAYNTTVGGIGFSSTVVPTGPHTVPPFKGGGRSRGRCRSSKRKSKRSRRTRHHTFCKCRRCKGRKSRRFNGRRSRRLKGGDGHAQYQNNAIVSNTYSLGGPLSASNSSMANPPPHQLLPSGNVDNLNHYALNAYGNSGSGMGFPSRGSY